MTNSAQSAGQARSDVYTSIAHGDTVGPLRSEVTLASIRAFGEATLDFNALHFDESVAQARGVAGTGVIAHGMSTYALMTRLLTDWLGARGGIHRRLETRWLAPARPGDVLHASAVVTAKRETSHSRWVELQLKVHGARGALIATGEALVEFPRPQVDALRESCIPPTCSRPKETR